MNKATMKHNLSYMNDGISLVNGFISYDETKILNDELDYLFSKKSVNGSLREIKVNKHTSIINMPTLAVRSINLLELCLSVKRELEKHDKKFNSYVNTGIEIRQDSRQPALPWHTDNRNGMVRAMIYIGIDKKKSGIFRYMKKSHKRDFYVEHHLSKQEIEAHTADIVNCDVPEGTLILFDSFGFHGRKECLGKRRIIMFEFQAKNSNSPISAVPLSSRILTDNVLSHLSVFLNGATEYTRADMYYRDPPERNIILRIIGKFRRFYRSLRASSHSD